MLYIPKLLIYTLQAIYGRLALHNSSQNTGGILWQFTPKSSPRDYFEIDSPLPETVLLIKQSLWGGNISYPVEMSSLPGEAYFHCKIDYSYIIFRILCWIFFSGKIIKQYFTFNIIQENDFELFHKAVLINAT